MASASDMATNLLKKLISIPSPSKEEDETATLLEKYLTAQGCEVKRDGNNVWTQTDIQEGLPTLLLNSHHDTVRPVSGWTHDPHTATELEGKITGLGSNDAGASLVCLLHSFLALKERDVPYNLVFLASAEEEISGLNGVASVLRKLPRIDFGLVGEPTGMKAAIAEKGLLVIDAFAKGKSGHAARNEGQNAIYLAMEDIQRAQNLDFPRISDSLGAVKVTVTQIESGTQHNVIPDSCHFVLDVRTNEQYSNEEILAILKQNLRSGLTARSLRLNSSGLPADHPALKLLDKLKIDCYGSPTLSDQALMPFPTLKMGPGESERSHTADEFVYRSEIAEGIDGYLRFLKELKL